MLQIDYYFFTYVNIYSKKNYRLTTLTFDRIVLRNLEGCQKYRSK